MPQRRLSVSWWVHRQHLLGVSSMATRSVTRVVADFPRRRSDSVLAWRLGAEARGKLLHPGHPALGALWRPFLQAIVFADRDAYLKVLAARLALELVHSHDFPPPKSAPTGNARTIKPPRPRR